jgi:hypothetical protein
MTQGGWTIPPPAGMAMSNFNGELIFVIVGGYENEVDTQYRKTNAVRVTMLVLSGPHAGEIHENVMIFNNRVVQRLRGAVGQAILGVVTTTGRNNAVDLEDPGPAGYQVANAYDASNPGMLAKLIAEAIETHRIESQRQATAQQRQQTPQGGGYGQSGGESWKGGQQQWQPQPTPPPNQPPQYSPQPTPPPNQPPPGWTPEGASGQYYGHPSAQGQPEQPPEWARQPQPNQPPGPPPQMTALPNTPAADQGRPQQSWQPSNVLGQHDGPPVTQEQAGY